VTGSAETRRWISLAAALLLAVFAVLLAQRLIAGSDDSAQAKKRKGVTLATKTYMLSAPDQKQRLTVTCPGHKIPFGGGMSTNPPPSQGTGEGVYPHSYERLGVQHGYHVTAVLYDPSKGSTTPRSVTLQVLCGSKLGHMTPPHTTVNLGAGETKSAVATCPGKRHLIGGGFQRTDFTSKGGDFVTESRAISAKSWRVSGHSFGSFGGELTAIAYCLHSKKPLVTTVSGQATVDPHQTATAETPTCPAGRKLVFGGFSTDPAGSTFFTNGGWTPSGARSATGFDNSGSPSTLTAYGYCLKV
jgi:hypothetical protein